MELFQTWVNIVEIFYFDGAYQQEIFAWKTQASIDLALAFYARESPLSYFKMSSNHSSQIKDNQQIAEILIEVERSLDNLSERYTQIKQDWATYNQLWEQQQDLQQKQQNNVTKEPIKTELKHLQQKLAEVELNLESRLLINFSPFWQVVRFVGLGIVIGWLLKTWAS